MHTVHDKSEGAGAHTQTHKHTRLACLNATPPVIVQELNQSFGNTFVTTITHKLSLKSKDADDGGHECINNNSEAGQLGQA